ncbi:MAG: ATP-dependent DNA helicase, partial [Phycisphaerales bacterium]|nr:ATP-dependent DNA helicase [Phycisphaerales bacterium]
VRAELRHAVVDEFQDVNEATIVLLEQVFPASATPDLCIVGDDDQAIYGFRGADDRAFGKFAARWPGAAVIKLEENYRSQPPIIAVANSTIAAAAERFDPTKTVRRADRFADEPSPAGTGVVIVESARYGDNGEPIAAMILAERQKNPAVRWKDFAVVARGHSELDKVSLALEAEGIPVVRRRERSALTDQGVKDLMAWCRVLVNPRDTEHARRLLLRPPVAFNGPRVIRLLGQYAGVTSVADIGEGEDPGAFIPWLAQRLPDEPSIRRLAAVYSAFREKAAGLPAGELLYELALRVDAVHCDLLPAPQRAARLASVVSLLRFAIGRQSRLPEPGDLRAFLEYFDDLNRSEQEGLDDQARIDGGDGDEETGGDGVQLMTAHSAKGLEFDTVFVPRVNPGNGNYPSVRAPEPRLPAGLLELHGTGGDAKTRQLAEERRLFYVACTRAERRLVILGNLPKGESGSTHFLQELSAAQPELPTERTDAESVNTAFRAGAAATIVTQLREGIARRDRTHTADELSTRARIDAATALDTAAAPSVDAADLAAVSERLASAARRLAVIAHAHATGEPPAWSLATPGSAAESHAIAEAINAAAAPAPDGRDGVVFDAPRPPLRLSYTEIDQFTRCPACWYLKYRLRLEKPASTEINIGTVAHEALCDFYLEWSSADAQSRPQPGTERLLEIGRARFIQHAAASPGGVDRAELDRLAAMLTTAHQTLHGRDGHDVQIIEKPELSLSFPYVSAGVTHQIKAKIDRLERTADGGVRIVDYKTGQDWAKLTEPKKDDLQMGIYALAIDHHFNGATGDGSGDTTPGVAEYWLLAKGVVGAIALDKLDRKKIRKVIDAAIAGILSGSYEPKKDCREGLCALLRPGVVIDP